MKRVTQTVFGRDGMAGVLLAAFLLSAVTVSRAAPVEDLSDWVQRFERQGPRAPGQPGNRALEASVRRRFESSGFTNGVLRFDAPVLQPGFMELDFADGTSVPLESMQPSLMRPGNFDEDDFDTRLIYLGAGTVADLERASGIALEGGLAVMEFASGDRWMDLMRFGLRGFVFLSAPSYAHLDAVGKVYNSEVAVPRFFAGEEATGVLRDRFAGGAGPVRAGVRSKPSRWRMETLGSPWVLVQGTDPDAARDTLLLTASLDAAGVVPAQAYGGDTAGNLMLLLDLVARWRETPPRRSVLLVAVNGHTLGYLGERMLAWHLLQDGADITRLRNDLAREMRVASVYVDHYRTLRLEPLAGVDSDTVHDLFNIMWAVYGDADPVDPLNLGDEQLQEGIERALAAIDMRMRSMGARMFMTPGGRQHELEARLRLEALRSGDHDDLRARLSAVESAFLDERTFEAWRAAIDQSTGVRVVVKSRLQDQVNRNLNIVKLAQMDLSRDGVVDKAEIAALEREREVLTKILVLFNKIDIGFGRERVRYRQIAADEETRAVLMALRDDVVAEMEERVRLFERRLDMDMERGALRDALGTQRIRLAVSLGMDWTAGQAGFMALNRLPRNDWFRRFGDVAAQVASGMEAQGPPVYRDTLSTAVGQLQDDFFFGHQSPAGVFHAADGTPSVALRAVSAAPSRAFTPRNRIGDLDAPEVRRRFEWLGTYLAALADAPELGATDVLPRLGVPAASRLWSCLVRTFEMDEFAAKPTPSLPVPDTILTAYAVGGDTLPSVVDGQVANVYAMLGDSAGFCVLYGLAHPQLAPTAYRLDARQNAVLSVIDKGRVQQARQILSNLHRTPSKTLPMFNAREFVIRDRLDPSRTGRRPVKVDELWVFSALSRALPQKYGVHGVNSLSRAVSHRSSGPAGIYQEYRARRHSGESLMVMTQDRRFAVNPSGNEPEGEGFASASDLPADFFLQAARDMYIVTRHRLGEMTGIVNELVDEFLSTGLEALEGVAGALQANDHNQRRRLASVALGNVSKSYAQIREMNADMLKAIMIYMALMLPFCYFLQKLIFSFTRIEHEMLAFSGLFVVTYLGFRLIHPAFSIAMSPEAIFLAFVLGAVGVFVTAMLQSRFSAEMDLLFRGASGFAGETTTAFVGQTAMIIGVNNMKRRRTRTLLTTATIVLVVFTMLAFSSVSRKARPTLIRQSESAPYSGLLFTWPDGSAMDEGTLRTFEMLYADRAGLLARRVLRPDPAPDGSPVRWSIVRADGSGLSAAVSVLLSLSPEEARFSGVLPFEFGGGFSSPDADEIVLPRSLAAALNLQADDVGRTPVDLLGRLLTVTGVIDDDRYRNLRDLDPRLPLLPGRGVGEAETDDGSASRDGVLAQDMATLVFLPPALLRRMGGRPYSISVRLDDPGQELDPHALWREADLLLRSTDAMFVMGSVEPFLVGEEARRMTEAGVYQVVGAYRTTIGGMARLIIPLLIAGLILFNTMLSTVYERKAEIAIYNAIGLNPRHIFIFFLAEALVYGVIGAIGGYLIGQILAMIAQTFDLVRGMNVNFSSLMVVWAILFTISLVLLSTLYPAWVATRTAVPSGTSRWGLPPHDGTRMEVDLPFIYDPGLVAGVMAYLHEIFSSCVEGTMSEMLADSRRLETGQADGHRFLRAEYGLALAPYDLGVTQSLTVEARFIPSLESYGMRLDIHRESGQDTSWATVNLPMLERLRKALLRWRNMDSARHQEYVNMGKQLFEV